MTRLISVMPVTGYPRNQPFNHRNPSPLIAITAGDPCGIGAEIILKTLRSLRTPMGARLLVIGTHALFERAARQLGLRLPPWHRLDAPAFGDIPPRPLTFIDCPARGTLRPGHPTRAAGSTALAYLDQAIALWRHGRLQGVVTAPVTKWAIAQGTPGFLGQTEYLARAMRVRDVVMMFVSDHLRVALLTRHVPLHRVTRDVTAPRLRMTLRLTADALTRWFGRPHPRLALCGLNPHAGEEGRCGLEERRLMAPVLRSLRRQGLRCDGPFSADGFFAEAASRYDAVICPYHDQGLIPFKLVARDQGCQLSVGLPIIRTSPDHGSALDIAGQGAAHSGSMRYALELAIRLSHRYQISAPTGESVIRLRISHRSR